MSKLWIKLYHEILNDPKMMRLSDRLFRRAIELFLMAGECGKDGELPSIDDMSWRLRVDVDTLQVELDNLQANRIVSFVDGVWIVTKFSERQAATPATERWKNWNDKKNKQQYYSNEPTNGNQTKRLQSSNDKLTDKIRIDKEKDKKSDAKNASREAHPVSEKPKPPKHPDRQELTNYFLSKTGLPVPPRSTNPATMQRLWWSPIDEILNFCAPDYGLARDVIDKSVSQLKSKGMTISDPNSILKTARSVFAERNAPAPSNNASEVY